MTVHGGRAALALVLALAAAPPVAAAGTGPSEDGQRFGDLAWPCRPGDGDNADANANADDSSTPGVTAEEITIGIGDDAGFSLIPGLNHEATDAMEALIATCNELGGINGRQIVANYYDAKFAEVATAIQQACDDGVFFMVGEGWANDNDQEELRQGCGLPAVPTYTVSGVFAHAPLMYQGNPNPADEGPGSHYDLIAQAFPAEIQRVGMLTTNAPAVLEIRDKTIAAASQFGWGFVSTDVLANPLGEADWTPLVDQLRGAGAEVVWFGGTCFPTLQLFAQTAVANDYSPILFAPANIYERRCYEANADGALDNLYFTLAYVPIEEAASNPATQDYVDLVSASGGDLALLGMQAASSFLLWATAADACGAGLTRECVLANLAATTEWTAGGLHAPSNPGGNHTATCGALFKFSGTTIERVLPAEAAQYACDESYAVTVSGPWLDPLELDADRVSQVFSS